MINNKSINKHYDIFVYIMICIFVLTTMKTYLDNDGWFLLNSGRFIVQNGVYTNEPFSCFNELNFMFQQWLSCLYFWKIYNIGGVNGLCIIIAIEAIIELVLFYKLMMYKTNQKRIISIIMTFICYLFSKTYYVTRPQITTFISIILIITCIEHYINSNKYIWLIGLPIISIFEINLHCSIWWMLIIITLPYLCDYIMDKTGGHDAVYKKQPLIIAVCSMFLTALFNPYGYNALLYLPKSLNGKYKTYIMELQYPIAISGIIIIIVILMLIYAIFTTINFINGKQIAMRNLFLLFGGSILGFTAYRNMSISMILILIGLVSEINTFIDSMDLKSLDIGKFYIKLVRRLIIGGYISTILILCILRLTNLHNNTEAYQYEYDILNYMQENRIGIDNILGTTFNNGGFYEFYGYKCSMDTRMEVYNKQINGVDNYYEEYIRYILGDSYYKDYIDKYNFDYMILGVKDKPVVNIRQDDEYRIVYENEKYVLIECKKD